MIVQTKNGKIKGFEKHSVASGKKYHSFLGVPYAKPPLGQLRFLAPEPLESWNETYDATYERNVCFQAGEIFDAEVSESEDCLYLNIHTPEVNPTSSKPVLLYIPGGGFVKGGGLEANKGPDYLINYDVVLVTINYRTNILGFLNLSVPECPGNAGLKDQVMAIKWVKENIKAFGGNPDNITIDGCSSGASSVNLLMISPLAKGLFQKAIMHGGTALSTWSLVYEPTKWAFKAGKKLGFIGEDRVELLNFFKTFSGKQLANVVVELLSDIEKEYPARCFFSPFAPSVEVIRENAFLPDFPRNLVKLATPVPCMAGHTGLEWTFRGEYHRNNIFNFSESMIQEIITSNFIVPKTQLEYIKNEIIRFYFRENDKQKSDAEKIGELLSDICCFHFYDALEFETLSNLLYVFHFTYFSKKKSFVKNGFKQRHPTIKTALHSEEQHFILFDRKRAVQPYTDVFDIKVQKNMCQLWANFMKSGNPVSEGIDVTWKPHTAEEPYYLQIDADLKPKNGRINEARIFFLRNLLHDVEMIK